MNDTLEQPSVCFHTNTEIDERSWSVMGMHAKETNDPVGLFGTGLKYSLCIILRSGHEIEIYSGDKHYVFGLTKTEFRGKEFEQVTCNGETLPFTTEYGKNWTMEGAYRELVSNCMDEGGIHFAGSKVEGGTSIVVRGKEFHSMLERHNDIFLGDREPIYSTNSVDIYKGAGTIFYKGVKVGVVENAMHSYLMKDHLSITEDRTMAGDYTVRYSLGRAVAQQITDEKLLRAFMTRKGGFESNIDWEWDWSETALKVGKQLWKESPTSMGNKCRVAFKARVKDADVEHVDMTPLQEKAVTKAIEFLQKAGYQVECPVRMVANKDSNVIAYYYKGEIFLTERCFDQGLNFLVQVMFEESHHHTGYTDESRAFQSYLIKEVVKQSAKALGEFL
jgi:hypothetical protein